MMRLKILNFIVILVILGGFAYPQDMQVEESVSNINIYSKLLDRSLNRLENQLIILGKDNIYCASIKAKPDVEEYLYLKIKQKLNNYKIVSDTAGAEYIIKFENVKFKTKYEKIFGSMIKNRKVQRRIEIAYDININKKGDENTLFSDAVNDFSEDEFNLENKDNVERGDYEFVKGNLPEQSFWEKALIPGIVILTTAAAIVLFFEIRSK